MDTKVILGIAIGLPVALFCYGVALPVIAGTIHSESRWGTLWGFLFMVIPGLPGFVVVGYWSAMGLLFGIDALVRLKIRSLLSPSAKEGFSPVADILESWRSHSGSALLGTIAIAFNWFVIGLILNLLGFGNFVERSLGWG